MPHYRILPAGDSSLVVEFGDTVDPELNARAIAFAERLRTAGLAGVLDVVPTYRSAAVYFDPLRANLDALLAEVDRLAARPPPVATAEGPPIEVPVCYGPECGPDLADVAKFAGCGKDEVVRTHASQVYRVYMMGFVPGFAYMGTVPSRIGTPRRSTPRLRVPLGSVGVAGFQTGIYPAETPGGWNLVGRTPLRPFDAARAEPFLFKAGDGVRFVPIDHDEFEVIRRRS